jgi:toxin HigB-1
LDRSEEISGKRESVRRQGCSLPPPSYNVQRYTFDVMAAAFYAGKMIRSFRDRATERLWTGAFVKRFSSFEKQALRKLDMLHNAGSLGDLRAPPANRLEALAGDRRGQHSIRINDQWRICFTWTEEGPANVEIVDYH